MDIQKIVDSLEGCSCGRKHDVDLKAVYIDSDVTEKAGKLLGSVDFPKKLLAVADKNTLAASGRLLQNLEAAGYDITLKLYDDLTEADMEQVEIIKQTAAGYDGVLSIGTGSNNDICRLGSFRADKPLAIYATAPSMDGFASDSAPITTNNFKVSHLCRQPKIVLADTRVLAAAPVRLKSSGFGDMIAKYVGLVDWQAARLLIDEYYCENIANITLSATDKIVALADKVTENSEEAAAAIMESLVMTGIAMQFAHCTRPASGAEHVVSHFWEDVKLEHGLKSDLHGRKVGVATLAVADIYKKLAKRTTISAHYDNTDWDKVAAAYGPNLYRDVEKFNNPSVLEGLEPRKIEENWAQIRHFIDLYLPERDELLDLFRRAGAPTTAAEIDVTPELYEQGLQYSPYMRHRLTIMRLMPMLNV